MAGNPLQADLDAILADAAPVGRRNGSPINIPNIDGDGEYGAPLAPQQPVMVQPPEEFAPVPPINILVTLGYLNPQSPDTLYEAEQDDSDIDDVEDAEDAEGQELEVVHAEPDHIQAEQVIAGQEPVRDAAVIFNAGSITVQDGLASVRESHDNEAIFQDINPNMDLNIVQPSIDIPDQLTGSTAASLDVLIPSLQSGFVPTRKRLAVAEDGLKGEVSHVDSQHISPDQKRFAVDKKVEEPAGSSNPVGASSSSASRSRFRLARWRG